MEEPIGVWDVKRAYERAVVEGFEDGEIWDMFELAFDEENDA